MELASNIARRDAFNRKGRNAFVSFPFLQWATLCEKLQPQFCTWYSYERGPLYEYAAENGWSMRGFSHKHKPPHYFEFIPFDFDDEFKIENSFDWARRFVDWLVEIGVPETHFHIWLSGSKGFHVEIDRVVFECESPSLDILRRVAQFVKRTMKALNITVDESLYSAGRLYRVPNTLHAKTGLFKTRILLKDFTWEYVEARETWANTPGQFVPEYSHDPIENPIPLPLVEEVREVVDAESCQIDSTNALTERCPVIRGLMSNPEGRELRRQAVGALLEAYGTREAPEVQALYEAWRENPFMDDKRMRDADHWLDEFDKDGVIKCQKSCTSFGCSSGQKKICGTQFPMDHLVNKTAITPITIEEARQELDEFLKDAIYNPNPDVFVGDMPIGLGKTEGVRKKLAADPNLSCAYLCPTHELAEQISENMTADGIDNRHIRSRSEMARKNILDCPYLEEVYAARVSGINAARSVCSKCPRFPANMEKDSEEPRCEYYQQFEGIKEVRAVIGVHSHANKYVFDQIGMPGRTFLAIDESALNAFSGEIPAVNHEVQTVLKAFCVSVIDELMDELEGNNEVEIEGETFGLFGYVRAQHAAEQAAVIMDAHRSLANVEERKQLARAVYLFLKAIILGLELAAGDLELLKEVNYWPQYTEFIKRVIERSKFGPAMELKEGYRHLAFPDVIGNAVRVTTMLGLPYQMGRSYFYPTEMPSQKVIILDATSNQKLYEKFVDVTRPDGLDRKLVYKKLPFIHQTQVHITQINNSGYSKSRITTSDDVLSKLTFVIKSLRSTFPDDPILCVSVLDLKEDIKANVDDSGKTEFAHFRNLRGKNKYANYPHQVILGGFFVPNVAIIEGLNRLGIYGVTEELLEASTITMRHRHVALNGDTYYSQRKAFRTEGRNSPLMYANLFLEQTAVSEVVQSIRQRLFSGEPDKRCYILTNVGLSGVYADKFCTLDELTLELEDLSGIKSDIDTSKLRTTNLWMMRLYRLKEGDEFTSEQIGEYGRDLRRFLELAQENGAIQRLGPKKFKKVGELDEEALEIKPKGRASRAVTMAALDQWLTAQVPKHEFTSAQVANETQTASVQFLKDWLADKISTNQIVKFGETKGTKYRKSALLFAHVQASYDV